MFDVSNNFTTTPKQTPFIKIVSLLLMSIFTRVVIYTSISLITAFEFECLTLGFYMIPIGLIIHGTSI